MNRTVKIYKAATQVMLMTAAAAVATLAVVAMPTAWAHAHGDATVSKTELARLTQCDEAVRQVASYEAAVNTKADADPALHAYWAAKDACKATTTAKASR